MNHNDELHTQVLRITPRLAHGTLVEIEAMQGCGFDGGTYAILKVQDERGDHRVSLSKADCYLIGSFLKRWAVMRDWEYK
jgi:hypothetical protein